MKNFWETLPKPFLVLAPMADVTDAAFRRMIAKYSKPAGPDVMYTEFVSADGLALAPEAGRAKLMRDLLYTQAERPIVAQFFTSIPAHMEKAAALAQELGFDGVDINMGCPVDAIGSQGAGARLITTPELAQELVRAAKRGAPNVPVSVKTRLGWNKDELEEWLPKLLDAEPVAVVLHARTRKEMSAVPARWDRVKRAVEIRNERGSKTLIIGNGDVADVGDAYAKARESGADGVMLGRAVFGKPWLFAQSGRSRKKSSGLPSRAAFFGAASRARLFSGNVLTKFRSHGTPANQAVFPTAFRLRAAAEHAGLFEELLGDIKNFAIMKKHFKAYAEGFDGAKELRVKLMETQNAGEVGQVIENFLKHL